MDMNVIQVHDVAPQIDPALVERFQRLATSAISDSMRRVPGTIGVQLVGDSLRNGPHVSMAGTAMTVRTRPGDNLAVHVALDRARAGDVIVVDARGDVTNAILGELMSAYAQSRGLAGLVVDGAVRDHEDLASGSLPVFARGISHLGPFKTGPGELHATVSIGGIGVRDGDLIVGDHDGLVVVPAAVAADVATAAEAIRDSETAQLAHIQNGTWDRSWLVTATEVRLTRSAP